MNEQVEKLARECGAWKQVYGNRNFMIDEHFDIEKFAELIVKECVAQCWTVSEMEHKGDVISECSKRMRKHFGVEE